MRRINSQEENELEMKSKQENSPKQRKIEAKDYIPYVSGILWAVDKELRYLDIEGHKLKEWKLAKEDVIGKTVQEFHQETEAGTNTRNHRLTLIKGDVSYQVEFAGTNYDCKLHYYPDREIIVGVATDITREMELEKQVSSQESSLLELSAPVIPVLDHVVIVPISGQLTFDRTRYMQDHIVQKVHELFHVNTVILDFSGVTDVIARGDAALQEIYQSLKLLGIETILTGMTPTLSKSLIEGGSMLMVNRIYSSLKVAVSVLAKEEGK